MIHYQVTMPMKNNLGPRGSCGFRLGCPCRRHPQSGSAPTLRAGVPSGPGAPDSPRPSSAAFASCLFGGGNLCGAWAEAAPAGRRAGGLVNGCSATGGDRRSQIRYSGGGCHGRAAWVEARAREAEALRRRRLGLRLSPGSEAPGEVAAAASLRPLRLRSRRPI